MSTTVPIPVPIPLPADPFSPDYARIETINSSMQQAYIYNLNNANAYLQASHDYNAAYVNAGGPPQNMTFPVPKLMRHIDPTTGAQTDGPDPVVQPLPLPPLNQPSPYNPIVNPNPPVDRLDQVIAMLGVMQGELLAIKSKVGA